ncbi:MAG TPA: YceI family protein [Oculatellaceae cyanobacterium]
MLRNAILATSALALVSLPAVADSDEWTVDPAHTSARFSVKHMMISNVNGDFAKVGGTVKYDGKSLDKATINATIDVNSVDTHDENRDKHLKTADFFDTAKYPTITFKSTKIEPGKDGFKIYGDLTMHGVTKNVVLNAEPLSPVIKAHGALHVGTSATTKINRKEFGLNFNKTLDNGGAMVGDDVNITLDVELKQATQEKTGEAKAKSDKS